MSLSSFLFIYLFWDCSFSFWEALFIWIVIAIFMFLFLVIYLREWILPQVAMKGSFFCFTVGVTGAFYFLLSCSGLFSLCFFHLLTIGDFLGGRFLLFDPVALVSVHHPSGRIWSLMGLCASKTSMLALQAEAVTSVYLNLLVYPFWFQPGRVAVGFLGWDSGLFVVWNNGDFQSVID